VASTSGPRVNRGARFSGRVGVMFGTQILGAAIGIVNGILLARLLGPAGKGDYYLLVTLPATAVVLIQLGLPGAFEYFTARGQSARLIRRSFVLTALLSAIVYTVVVALLTLLEGTFLHGVDVGLLLFVFLAVPLGLLATFSSAIVLGRQAVRLFAAVKLSYPLAATVLIIVILGGYGASVANAIVVFVIVATINAVAYLVAAVLTSRTVPLPSVAPYRQLIRYGLQFYPGSLAGYFSYRSDVYLIALMMASPSAPLGYYSMAVGLAEMIFFFPNAVSSVFFPHVAGSSREDADRQVAPICRATLLISGFFAVLMVPAAGVLFAVVLPGFDQSIPPLLVLLPGVVALSGANVVGGYVTGIGQPGVNSVVSVIAFVVNVVANLLLIPRFGIVGAAAASLISYSLSSLLLTAVAARYSRTPLTQFWIPRVGDVRYLAGTSVSLARRVQAVVRPVR
jgi:O-antigen/teichoic acid export membrane protein